jgi:hypothetical protein
MARLPSGGVISFERLPVSQLPLDESRLRNPSVEVGPGPDLRIISIENLRAPLRKSVPPNPLILPTAG